MKIKVVSTFVLLLFATIVSAQVDEMQQAVADAERDVEKYVSLPAWGQWDLHAVVSELPTFTS